MAGGDDRVVVPGLTHDHLADADRLLRRCNQHETLDLPIDLDPAPPSGDLTTYFRCHGDGPLAGLAWLPETLAEDEPEACLMVDPACRRQGVGRALIAAVRTEARRRGLPGFLLVGDEASASGSAFLAAVGARYRSSEYRLVLDRTAIERPRSRPAEFHLRPAGAAEVETLTRIQAAAFGDPTESARARVTQGLRDPTRRYYLGELAGEPIGLLRVGECEGHADVTAFGVLPAHQGQGYGRQMLRDAVEALLADGWERVLIEVATDNQRALGLYQSCGFRVATAYGFYEMTS